jgi:hypothetical protein
MSIKTLVVLGENPNEIIPGLNKESLRLELKNMILSYQTAQEEIRLLKEALREIRDNRKLYESR